MKKLQYNRFFCLFLSAALCLVWNISIAGAEERQDESMSALEIVSAGFTDAGGNPLAAIGILEPPDISAVFQIRNNSGSEAEIYAFLAQYSKDGVLTETVDKAYTIPAGSSLTVTDLKIEPDEIRIGTRLRLLILDKNLAPVLTQRVEIGARYTAAQFRDVLRAKEQEILSDTQEEQRREVQPYMELSENELVAKVREEQEALKSLQERPAYEEAVARMSLLYQSTGDETYARYCILAMETGADTYDTIPGDDETSNHDFAYQIPRYCIFAYNNIYTSPQWKALEKEKNKDVRAAVEEWFVKITDHMYEEYQSGYLGNLAGYGLRGMAGAAVVLDRPDIVRQTIKLLDNISRGYMWCGDGTWCEGSMSYGTQMAGNCLAAGGILKLYTDPENYSDEELGLTLRHTDLSGRWPVFQLCNESAKMLKYPNGTAITWADTSPQDPAKVNPSAPMQEKYLKNIELNHYGFYTLTSGDTAEAQTVSLLSNPVTLGPPYAAGHLHGNFLSLTLFGGGMEVLPDQGYPVSTLKKFRYFHMGAIAHNTAWVWDEAGSDYSAHKDRLSRTELLAYDDGVKNNKQVQVIEISAPQAEEDNIQMKRRMLVMVKTSENHSYVFDMQRLKGGTVHENFLRASEDEDTVFETARNLETCQMPLSEYVTKYLGGNGGLAAADNNFIAVEKAGKGEEDFSFSWTGEKSGTKVQIFVRGEKETNIAFSKMPTLRRTYSNFEAAEEYPGWHFYQRRDVTPDDITKFSSVYETIRNGEKEYVTGAEWIDIDLDAPMCSLAKITGRDYVDYIYVSDDETERSYDGITFSGPLAVLRIKNGEAEWGYLYSAGKIVFQDFAVAGNPKQEYTVKNAQGSMDGSVQNRITLDASPGQNLDLKGGWVISRFGDGTAIGHRIEGVDGDTLTVNNVPGYEIQSAGAKMLYFPAVYHTEKKSYTAQEVDQPGTVDRIALGKVTAVIHVPVFKRR